MIYYQQSKDYNTYFTIEENIKFYASVITNHFYNFDTKCIVYGCRLQWLRGRQSANKCKSKFLVLGWYVHGEQRLGWYQPHWYQLSSAVCAACCIAHCTECSECTLCNKIKSSATYSYEPNVYISFKMCFPAYFMITNLTLPM